MRTFKTTCIMCPVSCQLTVKKVGKEIKVSGNECNKGIEYGISEYTSPKRIVTALIKTSKGVLPVKTTKPVPKKQIKKVLKEIAKLNIKESKVGDVVIKNILNLNVDVVVTGNY